MTAPPTSPGRLGVSRYAVYARAHPARRRLTNKLAWIKKNYGVAAWEHFVAHHICKHCGEDRIACLAVHHVEGKSADTFETLCHNCHALEHSDDTTFEDGVRGRTRPLSCREAA